MDSNETSEDSRGISASRGVMPAVEPVPDPQSDLDKAHSRSVRLVISIPVITLLAALGPATVMYVFQLNFAEGKALSQIQHDSYEQAVVGTLMISIVFSIICGLVGFILARQIVSPIKDVVKTMQSLAEGDFSTKLKPIQLGEFGQLGMTFNRMVDQLNTLFAERDRQLRESFGGAHLVLDRDGVVVQADQSTNRVLGVNPADLTGQNLLDGSAKVPLLHTNPMLLRALRELTEESREGRTASRSLLLRNEGVSAVRYLISALYLEGQAGAEPRYLVEVRDITGIAGFYEQMQRADRLAAVGSLATGIAHEIRNPLASIRGMVQLLDESCNDQENPMPEGVQSDYHRRIQREVDRLEKLVAGIMNFAHAVETPLEDVDIGALLRDVMHSAQLQAGEGAEEVEVEWELDPQMPRALLQAERLRQALHNLAINAYQQCIEKKCSPIRVQTMYLAVNHQRPIIICIANPGEPIEEAMRERLFEPFFTTKSEGTGLGLPIAYQTIRANGGMLEMECEDDEIQFWIRLPLEASVQRSDSGAVKQLSASS
ncbi:MAG TPA: histidine kinase dimerization/phospho-acceptor domain-containing protein [Candidatus Sumerlaeota bacterium]|nr:histidine kinase dimerization/phospho-acceptor domain-containing protein [Candidatus Sumerlaeota bacterium]